MYVYKLEIDNEMVGGYTLQSALGIFSPKRYGQLLMWYVDPKHRGGLHGLRLLKHAMKTARDNKLAWLEVNPWADAHGAEYVLTKLGFIDAVHTFIMRMD
jgi:ribosomal protein S18 acetylase RimI-like enzyme